jgi:hypothetical protein
MTEQNSQNQESYRDLLNLANKLLSIQKKSSEEVKNTLIEKGLDEPTASQLIFIIENRIKQEQKKAKEDMEKGGIFFGIGVVITALTFLFSTYTKIYIITWGIIIYGAFLFLRGFSNWKD